MFEFFFRWLRRRPAPVTVQLEEFVDRRPVLTVAYVLEIGERLEALRAQFGISEITSFDPGYRNQKPCIVISIPRNSIRAEAMGAFREAAQAALQDTGLTVFVEKGTGDRGPVEAMSIPTRPISTIAAMVASRTVRTA